MRFFAAIVFAAIVFPAPRPPTRNRLSNSNALDCEKAQAELQDGTDRLARLQQTNPTGSKGFTKAGVQKMIARLHEELAVYECSEKIRATAVK